MKWTFLWKVSKPTSSDASSGPLPGMLPLKRARDRLAERALLARHLESAP